MLFFGMISTQKSSTGHDKSSSSTWIYQMQQIIPDIFIIVKLKYIFNDHVECGVKETY